MASESFVCMITKGNLAFLVMIYLPLLLTMAAEYDFEIHDLLVVCEINKAATRTPMHHPGGFYDTNPV